MAAVDASEPADPMPRRQRLPTEVIGRSPLHPRPLACDVTAFPPPSGTPAPIQLINAGIFVYNFFFQSIIISIVVAFIEISTIFYKNG